MSKAKTPVKRIIQQVIKPEPPKIIGRSVRTESGEVFIIQKLIPISGTYRSLGPSIRYPFAEMAAGDSFEIKVNKTEIKAKVSRMSSACVSYCKRANQSAKFTVRRTTDESVRVWRIK